MSLTMFGVAPQPRYYNLAADAPKRSAVAPASSSRVVLGTAPQRWLVAQALAKTPDEVTAFALRNLLFVFTNRSVAGEFLRAEGRDVILLNALTVTGSVVAHEVAHAVLHHMHTDDHELRRRQEGEACALVARWGFVGNGSAVAA